MVKNSVFIRFYSSPDVEKRETVVDFNIFAAFKKTSLAFYLSPVTEELDARVAKMLWMLGQLVEFMESLSKKSEIIFSEGFHADCISQPNLEDLMEEKEDDHTTAKECADDRCPVEGELLMLTERGLHFSFFSFFFLLEYFFQLLSM